MLLSKDPSHILERDRKLDEIIKFIGMLDESAYRSIFKLLIPSPYTDNGAAMDTNPNLGHKTSSEFLSRGTPPPPNHTHI